MSKKYKECTICHAAKALDQFPPNKKSADGRLNQCRECRNAQARRQNKKTHRITIHDGWRYIEIWGPNGDYRRISIDCWNPVKRTVGLVKIDGLRGWEVKIVKHKTDD